MTDISGMGCGTWQVQGGGLVWPSPSSSCPGRTFGLVQINKGFIHIWWCGNGLWVLPSSCWVGRMK